MEISQSAKSSSIDSSITDGAPDDMNTFLKVYNKYKELEDRLDAAGIASTGNWLLKEVTELPTASASTINTIYKDNDGESWITYEDAGTYTWVQISSSTEDIKATLQTLENKIDGTGDTTDDIDTLPEVVDFLKGYTKDETLKDSISVSTEDTSDTNPYNDVFNN